MPSFYLHLETVRYPKNCSIMRSTSEMLVRGTKRPSGFAVSRSTKSGYCFVIWRQWEGSGYCTHMPSGSYLQYPNPFYVLVSNLIHLAGCDAAVPLCCQSIEVLHVSQTNNLPLPTRVPKPPSHSFKFDSDVKNIVEVHFCFCFSRMQDPTGLTRTACAR